MGYTHYWSRKGTVSQKDYENALTDIRKIVEAKKSILANGSGDTGTKPEVDDGVCFNGRGEQSHETFHLPALIDDLDGDFCKTNRKPYDDVVVACLTVLHNYCSGITVSSDGDTDEELGGGLKLAQKVLKNPSLVALLKKVPANAAKFIEAIPKSKSPRVAKPTTKKTSSLQG